MCRGCRGTTDVGKSWVLTKLGPNSFLPFYRSSANVSPRRQTFFFPFDCTFCVHNLKKKVIFLKLYFLPSCGTFYYWGTVQYEIQGCSYCTTGVILETMWYNIDNRALIGKFAAFLLLLLFCFLHCLKNWRKCAVVIVCDGANKKKALYQSLLEILPLFHCQRIAILPQGVQYQSLYHSRTVLPQCPVRNENFVRTTAVDRWCMSNDRLQVFSFPCLFATETKLKHKHMKEVLEEFGIPYLSVFSVRW